MTKEESPLRARRVHAESIKIEVADGLARIGGLLGFLESFLELFFQQVGGVFLGLDRLLEDRLAAAVLLAHGFGGSLHIAEHLRLNGRRVSDNGAGFGINLENSAATGAGNFEIGSLLRHFSESYRKTRRCRRTSAAPLSRKMYREQVQHIDNFPAQQENGKQNDQDGQRLSHAQPA